MSDFFLATYSTLSSVRSKRNPSTEGDLVPSNTKVHTIKEPFARAYSFDDRLMVMFVDDGIGVAAGKQPSPPAFLFGEMYVRTRERLKKKSKKEKKEEDTRAKGDQPLNRPINGPPQLTHERGLPRVVLL
jgi:hypothetical protein